MREGYWGERYSGGEEGFIGERERGDEVCKGCEGGGGWGMRGVKGVRVEVKRVFKG